MGDKYHSLSATFNWIWMLEKTALKKGKKETQPHCEGYASVSCPQPPSMQHNSYNQSTTSYSASKECWGTAVLTPPFFDKYNQSKADGCTIQRQIVYGDSKEGFRGWRKKLVKQLSYTAFSGRSLSAPNINMWMTMEWKRKAHRHILQALKPCCQKKPTSITLGISSRGLQAFLLLEQWCLEAAILCSSMSNTVASVSPKSNYLVAVQGLPKVCPV